MAPGRRAAKSRESPVWVADGWRRPLGLGSSLQMPVSNPMGWRRLDAKPGSQKSGQLALDKHQGSAFQTRMGWQQHGAIGKDLGPPGVVCPTGICHLPSLSAPIWVSALCVSLIQKKDGEAICGKAPGFP